MAIFAKIPEIAAVIGHSNEAAISAIVPPPKPEKPAIVIKRARIGKQLRLVDNIILAKVKKSARQATFVGQLALAGQASLNNKIAAATQLIRENPAGELYCLGRLHRLNGQAGLC